jgi:hypothetical protein
MFEFLTTHITMLMSLKNKVAKQNHRNHSAPSDRNDIHLVRFQKAQSCIPMDKLAKFLPDAQWQQTGQHTYFCDDSALEDIWIKVAAELPTSVKGYGLQAWKTTGYTRVVEPTGYILPVLAISGEPRILGGPSLVPNSNPFHFEGEVIISGSLYYVVALPPSAKPPKNQA